MFIEIDLTKKVENSTPEENSSLASEKPITKLEFEEDPFLEEDDNHYIDFLARYV